MHPTLALVVVAIIFLAIGGAVGAVVMRIIQKSRQPSDLETKYSTLQNEYNQYQHSVAQHFVDTSRMIEEAKQQHDTMREHLVSGALRLTSAEVSQSILSVSESEPPVLENINLDSLSPPVDWAPKIPGQDGVLSEEFGLNDESKEDEDSIEVRTARQAATSE